MAVSHRVSVFLYFIVVIELWLKGTIFQPFNNFLLFFFDDLIDFVLLPDIISFYKIGTRWNQISAVFADGWLKGTLNIDLIFLIFMQFLIFS